MFDPKEKMERKYPALVKYFNLHQQSLLDPDEKIMFKIVFAQNFLMENAELAVKFFKSQRQTSLELFLVCKIFSDKPNSSVPVLDMLLLYLMRGNYWHVTISIQQVFIPGKLQHDREEMKNVMFITKVDYSRLLVDLIELGCTQSFQTVFISLSEKDTKAYLDSTLGLTSFSFFFKFSHFLLNVRSDEFIFNFLKNKINLHLPSFYALLLNNYKPSVDFPLELAKEYLARYEKELENVSEVNFIIMRTYFDVLNFDEKKVSLPINKDVGIEFYRRDRLISVSDFDDFDDFEDDKVVCKSIMNIPWSILNKMLTTRFGSGAIFLMRVFKNMSEPIFKQLAHILLKRTLKKFNFFTESVGTFTSAISVASLTGRLELLDFLLKESPFPRKDVADFIKDLNRENHTFTFREITFYCPITTSICSGEFETTLLLENYFGLSYRELYGGCETLEDIFTAIKITPDKAFLVANNEKFKLLVRNQNKIDFLD